MWVLGCGTLNMGLGLCSACCAHNQVMLLQHVLEGGERPMACVIRYFEDAAN